MRKTFILLVTLLWTCVVHGQNYNCLQENAKQYFTNSNGYLRGIAIDSVRVIGTDTVYYPFKMPRSFYLLLDSSDGSWVGSKVIKKEDGTFLFNNAWLDTITIKTQALAGDSWVFYKDTSSKWYSATLLSVDTMTFMGIADSVKRIKITAYNGTTINTADSINNLELILSRNNGFVCAFDLYLFPYHMPGDTGLDESLDVRFFELTPGSNLIEKSTFLFSRVDYHIPTKLEIYNFNVGDVFITHRSNQNYCGADHYEVRYDSIIGKNMSSTYEVNYLISYRVKLAIVPEGPAPVSYNFNSSVYVLTYDTSVLTEFARMPEASSRLEAWYYLPEDISNCRTGAVFKHKNIIPFEGCDSLAVYKTGFGKITVKEFYWGTCLPGYTIGCDGIKTSTLEFSVKDGIPCGVRHEINSVNETLKKSKYNIFPNPTTGTLNISGPVKIMSVAVCNLLGQVVCQGTFESNEVSLNVSHLPAGIYVAKINETVTARFVKE